MARSPRESQEADATWGLRAASPSERRSGSGRAGRHPGCIGRRPSAASADTSKRDLKKRHQGIGDLIDAGQATLLDSTPKRRLSRWALALYSTIFRPEASAVNGWWPRRSVVPIVTQRLGPQLGNRHRHDSLEADRARRQVNLSEPPITDPNVGAYVHVRPGDRALAVRMPVVGDELVVLVLDRVQVADGARAKRWPLERSGRIQSPYSTMAFTAAHLEPGALPCVSPRMNSSAMRSFVCCRDLRVRLLISRVPRPLAAIRQDMLQTSLCDASCNGTC